MKCLKMFGLLSVAAASLMALAGTASATTLTSSAGATPTIHATAGETTFHGFATFTCASSTVTGKVESHGAGVTARGTITALSLSGCLPNHVTVLTNGTGAKGLGTFELHADTKAGAQTGDGILTGSGTRITIQHTDLGISCSIETNNTHIGTIDGGGTNATLNIENAVVPRLGHSFFCGSQLVWTGTYTFNSPHNLAVH